MDNSNQTPEQKAREKIDNFLEQSGWNVVARSEYYDDLNACAIKEGLLDGNREADYLLFVGSKAIAVLEAKRAENKLNADVAKQVQNYSKIVPNWYKMWQNPLPFVFMSNGETLLFRDMREKEVEYKELRKMLTPKELVKMADIKEPYASLPALPKGLRDCQITAVSKLESSFKQNKNKALICLATGAGKTFTACTITYRLLTYTPVRRVLFLVDRNNLGTQAKGEFERYTLTENGSNFNSIYIISNLKNTDEAKKANVVISTIQRLFATLTGANLSSVDDDEEFLEESDNTAIKLEQTKKFLPPDFFDLIIIDECHRSIYGKWQEVLKYFNTAKMIGLTATPTPEAMAFFDNNEVSNYTYDDSVCDGVNVPYTIFRIKTQATQKGGIINQNEEIDKTSKLNCSTQRTTSDEQIAYTPKELDRSIINKAQIRLVIQTFKDSIYSKLYPEREANFAYLPKTLIFAKDDKHADNIIEQIKDIFAPEFSGKTPEKFVQKITCKAGHSNELIRQFRNNIEFRIAVTVTLVATGTDVKPLECVLFMRDVGSDVLYTQMKGRGCRSINDDILRRVTPNATSKEYFYLIDAIGVSEHEKSIPSMSNESKEKMPNLARLFELLAHGNLQDDYIKLLFNRLSRCANKGEKSDLELFEKLANFSLKSFVERLNSQMSHLPPFNDINEQNIERKALVSPLITNQKAKEQILLINSGFIKTIINPTDELISADFDKEKSKTYIQNLEKYLNENKDKIEALRIIYNSQNITITNTMLKDLEQKLLEENPEFKASKIWENYRILKEGSKVENLKQDEIDAITNLISIVRFAYNKANTLKPILRGYQSGFNLYAGQAQRPLNDEQKSLLAIIAKYIAQNGALSLKELAPLGDEYQLGIVNIFGGKDAANIELEKLAKFIIKETA